MCIICYKPYGANFPTKKQFKTMFRQNPDGAGFMYHRPGAPAVILKKGFMSYSEFRQALTAEKLTAADAVAFHFRIATHGGITPEMTQPFPLSARRSQLTRLSTSADVGVMHNGIISMCGDAKKMSDTAEFIRDYMTRLCPENTPLEKRFDDRTLNIIEACIGSRMLILTADGNAHILGHGWKKDGALYFSNDSYIDYFAKSKAKKKSTRAASVVYSWDDDLYDADDAYNWCDGYCESCRLKSQCYDTFAAADVGINNWR